jgi:hypothetical protein
MAQAQGNNRCDPLLEEFSRMCWICEILLDNENLLERVVGSTWETICRPCLTLRNERHEHDGNIQCPWTNCPWTMNYWPFGTHLVNANMICSTCNTAMSGLVPCYRCEALHRINPDEEDDRELTTPCTFICMSCIQVQE